MERVYLRSDVDLTRHVRTEAGVAKYHKPIGSPLGGGHTPTKKVVRTVKKAKKRKRVTPKSNGTVIGNMTAEQVSKKIAKETKALKVKGVGALPAKRKMIAVPLSIPPEKRAAVAKILNQHEEVSKAIDEMHGEAMSDPSKEGRLFSHLYKIAPFLKPGLEKVRKSKAGRKLKEIDYFHTIVDTFFDHFLGTFIGSGAVTMGATFGLKLIGGG